MLSFGNLREEEIEQIEENENFGDLIGEEHPYFDLDDYADLFGDLYTTSIIDLGGSDEFVL